MHAMNSGMGSKLLEDAITLFVVVNPVGLVPLFIALTTGQSQAQRRAIAGRAVVTAAAILIVFVVIGQIMLTGLGVTLPAFRVAGGLVLLVIALRMVLSEDESRAGSQPPARRAGPSDIAVFPLAMPFIAGPGAVMAAVLLTDNDTFTVAEQAATAAVMTGVLGLTYVILLGAETMQRYIGPTGANVLSRVLGLILTAVAAETMLEGLRAFLKGG
jgi:multiple antibiotic resistance protein